MRFECLAWFAYRVCKLTIQIRKRTNYEFDFACDLKIDNLSPSPFQGGFMNTATTAAPVPAAVNQDDLKLTSLPRLEIQQALRFPDISYDEFRALPKVAREELISRNRIISTDAYNRVMDHLLSQRLIEGTQQQGLPLSVATAPASYALQLRRSPFPYLVACGVEDAVERITSQPVSREEYDFAVEYHEREQVPFLNRELWQWVLEAKGGMLPIEIHGVPDGTVVLPGEPLLTVNGPSELIAHFEHQFHRVFYETLVATRARALVEIIGDPSRFIEVGLRGAVVDAQHMQALHAAFVGGGFSLTSSDGGAAALPIKSGGTIGHRYVQTFASEEEGFRFAIEHLERVTLLIDLIESYQGIDLALRLKDEYRDTSKKIWVRLDSGDILEQVRYYLTETNRLGLTDPDRDKLVVEGIDSLQEIAAIEQMIVAEFGADARARVMYGAGSLLISDRTSRSDASSGFKQTEYTDTQGVLQPTMKFSSSPGKGSYPGDLRMVTVDGQRTIAQAGERFPGQEVVEGFVHLYGERQPSVQRSSSAEARDRAEREFSGTLRAGGIPPTAVPSPATLEKIRTVMELYHLQRNVA